MSTDLHLHHHLPNLRISAVNSQHGGEFPSTPTSDQIHDVADTISSTITQPEIETETEKETDKENENDSAAAVADGETDESYRTPTSKESKIPEILNCPPAPKKRKPLGSCKRKLMDEFQFFEVSSNNEDVDAFFRSTFPKRTCPCT